LIDRLVVAGDDDPARDEVIPDPPCGDGWLGFDPLAAGGDGL
jgi:hypothetical protein